MCVCVYSITAFDVYGSGEFGSLRSGVVNTNIQSYIIKLVFELRVECFWLRR